MSRLFPFESLAEHSDHSLREEVLISLLTDEPIQETLRFVTPWWANCLSQNPFGSKLWCLRRAKVIPETLELATLYTKEALMFLVQDGRASEIDVKASSIPKGILIEIAIKLKVNPDFNLNLEVT
jgi:phage gp46-like protein